MKKAAPKKAAPPPRPEEPAVRYEQKHPAIKLPIPGEPPPLLSNYEGKKELLRTVPTYTIELDYASFMWLWRIVEAKALQHHTSATTRQHSPEMVEVSLRTVSAFRAATTILTERLGDLSGGRKRVLKRRG
jgi:hypothetical protein